MNAHLRAFLRELELLMARYDASFDVTTFYDESTSYDDPEIDINVDDPFGFVSFGKIITVDDIRKKLADG